MDEEDSGSELNFADNQDSNENNGESSDYFEPDDESTIDEQETFEALNNEVVTNQENEIHVLEQVRNLNFYKSGVNICPKIPKPFPTSKKLFCNMNECKHFSNFIFSW